MSQVKQSLKWIKCRGPESQVAKLKPYVADISMNLWRRDLLQVMLRQEVWAKRLRLRAGRRHAEHRQGGVSGHQA